MDKRRATVFDRILLLIAGITGGIGVGGVTGGVVGVLTAFFGFAVHPVAAAFGFGFGAMVGAVAGAIGGLLLAFIYMLAANRIAGSIAGAVVGAFVPYYLNSGTFIGEAGLAFFCTSVVAGAIAGCTMIVIFQRMDESAVRK